MLVGHFGVGLAAKRIVPETSAGTLMLASLLPDFVAWTLLLAGVEHARIHPGITRTNPLDLYDIAISHSLLTDAIWGLLLAGAYFLWRRHSRASWIILAVVLSHWLLDFLSHRPDMPLAPGVHQYFGLGLYNSPLAMLLVEGSIWFAGIIVYARCTRPRKRMGTYLFWSVAALLTAVWIVSLGGATPSALRPAGISSLIFFSMVVLWAYLMDFLRPAKEQAPPLGAAQPAGD